MNFKIEDNVPLPPKRGNTGLTDVLLQLQPGQSVFVGHESPDGSVRNVVQYVKRRTTNRRFATRIEELDVRIWRLE